MGFNSRGTSRQNNFDSFNVDPVILDANLYDSRYQNIRHDGSSGQQLAAPLGALGKTSDGRIFRYVRYQQATTAAVEGNTLMAAAKLTGSTTSIASDGSSIVVSDSIWTGTTATPLIDPDLVGAWIFLTASTGSIKQVFRRIVDHTRNRGAVANTLYLDRPISSAELPGGTPTYAIFFPYTVALTTGVTTPVVGVSVGALSARDTTVNPNVEYCGWMQVKGLARVLVTNGNTAEGQSSAASGILTPSSTAGSAINLALTTPTAAECVSALQFGFGRTVNVVDTSATGALHAVIDCTKYAF